MTNKTQEKMSFRQATNNYPHRYTMEHVPTWALVAAPNGKYYAPQYATDREWYDKALFPPHNPLGRHVQDCYSGQPSWPLGTWLDAPFVRGKSGVNHAS